MFCVWNRRRRAPFFRRLLFCLEPGAGGKGRHHYFQKMASLLVGSFTSVAARSLKVSRFSSSSASSIPDILAYLASGKTSPESNKVLKLQYAYVSMDTQNKHAFLSSLATSYATDMNNVQKGIASSDLSNKVVSMKTVSSFRASLIPKYETIFANIARENGLPFLLKLRSDLLTLIASVKKQNKNNTTSSSQPIQEDEELLSIMDKSLKEQLTTWFSVGFLNLERITYEGTGGGILEKIARYETVHKVFYKSLLIFKT